MRKLFYILCLVLFLGPLSCASVSHQSQSMPEEGSSGLALVKQKCTVCHGLPHPRRHTAHEWDQLLVLMTERMKEKQISYTSDEMQQIQSYLHRNAR